MKQRPADRFLPRSLRACTLFCLLSPLIWAPFSTTQAADNVHMYGALVAEPCVIAPGKKEIELDFGTIINKYLYLNTRTPGEPLELALADCDLELGTEVKVSFQGTESIALPGLLALDSGSEARGIAIGLETPQGKALAFNKASDAFPLQKGSTTIALRAYVRGEADALSKKEIGLGPFTATATFTLEYE